MCFNAPHYPLSQARFDVKPVVKEQALDERFAKRLEVIEKKMKLKESDWRSSKKKRKLKERNVLKSRERNVLAKMLRVVNLSKKITHFRSRTTH